MERSDELAELMARLYKALEDGDADAFVREVSDDAGVLAIGTDPSEW